MIGDLLDSPWKILIVALVIIVLFGSKKLPSAARSLGQSMRILKKEVQGLHEDEPEPPAAADAEAATVEATAASSGLCAPLSLGTSSTVSEPSSFMRVSFDGRSAACSAAFC